ncbi:MAG: TIGR00180 family glycosyltransferase [Planctomycetaceae bacterium]
MLDNLHERLTLVIPTHNRPAFLRRLFYFLEQVRDGSQIQIVDSSSPQHRTQNEAAVRAASSSLKIRYRHIEAGMISKCRTIMEDNVTTPFTVFCADDDFLMPDAVLGALEFLQRSPDYSCAQGVMVSLCTGKNNKCYALPCYSLENDSPFRRFRRLAGNWYSTFYSVYRTQLLTRAWQVTDENSDASRARIFPEILLSQLSVTQGKIKYLPGIYNLREEHTLNESAVTPAIADEENCEALYSQFREVMVGELVAASGATLEHAADVVDACYGYLRDGGKTLAQKKRTAKFRVRRECVRVLRRGMGIVRSDRILQRRRISLTDSRYSSDDSRMALELMLKHPHGIESENSINAA